MEILHQKSIDLERVADLCEVGIPRNQLEPRDRSIWHVTSLLKAARLIIKGNAVYPENHEAPSGIMSLGRIWETAVDCYLADYAELHGGVFQPDVVLDKDDTYGSLDGLLSIPSLPEIAVCECKLRFTLSLEIPLDHLRQIRAYCYLADTTLVYYVSGHISTTPPMVQALLRVIRFTPLSIEENWQGIVNTKRYLESLGVDPMSGNGSVGHAPRVLNKHIDDIPLDAIYVARPSRWGNPFKIGKDGTREEVIAKYADWLDGMIHNGRLDLEELRGKDLICFCAPEPCHADVLLELANK